MAVAHVERPSSTSSNGRDTQKPLQGITHRRIHLPDQLPTWMRIREYLKKGWDPVVINKHVDSVTMPKWVASAILVSFLGFAVMSWNRQSDQRDILIELRTELRLAKEAQLKKDIDEDQFKKDQQAWREVMNGQLREIKGMLTQQQINALERLQKSGQNNNQ